MNDGDELCGDENRDLKVKACDEPADHEGWHRGLDDQGRRKQWPDRLPG